MEFPTILSGPILRRVEPNCIYIWIATSISFKIGVELFQIDENKNDHSYSYNLLSDNSESKSIRLGKRVYISLVKITPINGSFPTNVLLGYNLIFTKGSTTEDLSTFGLLNRKDPNSIIYGDLKYPTFFINDSEKASVLYGSCRKLHGKGEDAMASADLQLQESYFNLDKRPNSLFLLGDQIYADDIADPLFPIITFLEKQLIGKNEELNKLDRRLEEEPFYHSINQIHGRQFILQQFCHFTSNHAHNHLMKFSEFATKYLLSWGPSLWEYVQEENLFPNFENELKNGKIYFVFNEEQDVKDRQEEHKQHEKRFSDQMDDIKQFIHTLPIVRRLLANIPTYMIFDDHDVTDDWNLSQDWQENVDSSPLASHIISNGLGSYWAFQGWGNDPKSFDQTFIKKMKRYFKTFIIGSPSYIEWTDCLRNYQTWHFIAPTKPLTVCLDSRTKRAFDSPPEPAKIGKIIEENIQGPQLISYEAWQKVSISLDDSGWKSGHPLIIAAQTPLYGIGLIESSIHSYIHPLRAIGIPVDQDVDFEAWKYNGKGFSEFLKWILEWNPSHCFIISGDVHYASSVKTIVHSHDGKIANIVQFTSSPLKNMSFSGIWGSITKFAIWLNCLERKNKNIHRYCTSTYRIKYEDKNSPCPPSYIWKEILNYLQTKNGDIIEIDNNLGLLEITPNSVQNTLLQYKNFEKLEIPFECVQLPLIIQENKRLS